MMMMCELNAHLIFLAAVSDSNLLLHPVFEISDCHHVCTPSHRRHDETVVYNCQSIQNEYLMGFNLTICSCCCWMFVHGLGPSFTLSKGVDFY